MDRLKAKSHDTPHRGSRGWMGRLKAKSPDYLSDVYGRRPARHSAAGRLRAAGRIWRWPPGAPPTSRPGHVVRGALSGAGGPRIKRRAGAEKRHSGPLGVYEKFVRQGGAAAHQGGQPAWWSRLVDYLLLLLPLQISAVLDLSARVIA
ncbi:hypothetical protein HPB48_013358 [Haemaphysalis longicornis]|uniref:Uncharacterized protein n=1 Tax=Haemaphysalis longicornis TaxID=44386 RepID=A0A9J6FHJ5_HAELO|nr:hypothetical protein HPB48_013358 [Haemaphysalis longicornis]